MHQYDHKTREGTYRCIEQSHVEKQDRGKRSQEKFIGVRSNEYTGHGKARIHTLNQAIVSRTIIDLKILQLWGIYNQRPTTAKKII